jgi:hypothetical protein
MTVTLAQYLHRAHQQQAAKAENADRFSRRDFVLVDSDDAVVDSRADVASAIGELNRRFDERPALIDELRLVLVEDAEVARTLWPSESAVERAGTLVAYLSRHADRVRTDDDLDVAVRWRFLRGRGEHTHLRGENRRAIELWWYRPDGEQDTVGLLVEHESEQRWQLLLDAGMCRLTEHQLHDGIAKTLANRLRDDRFVVSDIQRAAEEFADSRRPPADLGTAKGAVTAMLALAAELRLTRPLGPEGQ